METITYSFEDWHYEVVSDATTSVGGKEVTYSAKFNTFLEKVTPNFHLIVFLGK